MKAELVLDLNHESDETTRQMTTAHFRETNLTRISRAATEEQTNHFLGDVDVFPSSMLVQSKTKGWFSSH